MKVNFSKRKKILIAGVGLIVVLIIALGVMFTGMLKLTVEGRSDDTVITLQSPVSNIYLITAEDGFLMVDAGMHGQEEGIIEKLRELGIEPGDISLIIITHAHGDHFGTLAYLKEQTGADVLCHEMAVEYIETGASKPPVARNWLGTFMNAIIPEQDIEGVRPDRVMEDEFDLREYGVDGMVIHTPGHSSDSVSIVLDSGHAFVGDMFRGEPPGLSFGMFYEDEAELKNSIGKVISYNPKTIHLSHGEDIDYKELTDFAAGLS